MCLWHLSEWLMNKLNLFFNRFDTEALAPPANTTIKLTTVCQLPPSPPLSLLAAFDPALRFLPTPPSLVSRLTTQYNPIALFTRQCCIISAVVVRQFSTDGCSHRAKHLHLNDKPLCNLHRKPVLRPLKRRDNIHHDDDVSVFSRCFPSAPLSI